MKKILKRFIKNNKKAFTLIEMLGVIVIMGLILIVVFPTMIKMIHGNDEEELAKYYTIVEEAAHVYAAKLTDDLGTSKYTGCSEITLEDLITEGYITEFKDSNVTCTTGTGNIKIRNNKGVISVNFQLSCSEGGEDVFISGTNDGDTCEKYVMESQENLKVILESDKSIRKSNVNNEVYLIGANPSNYIWYSGKLWRVVSYNSLTEIVRMVTVNPITSIYYNSDVNNSSNYNGSDVQTWINTEFLDSLKDSQMFLINTSWNATPNTSTINNPISPDKVQKSKVGLLSTFDYGVIQDWYGSGDAWLMSEGTSGYSLYTSSGSIETASGNTMLGVRPVIALNSDVYVHSGKGTLNEPYIIDNSKTSFGKAGDYINTRFSGEYVKIGTNTYRIISNDAGTIKVIGTQKVGNYMYSDNHFDYASSALRTSLENILLEEQAILTHGDFCMDTINNAAPVYQSPKCLTPSRVNNNVRIGLPKLGDFFTTNIPGVTEDYWTLNPNTEIDGSGTSYNATMNLVTSTGKVTSATISTTNAAVIVIYLNEDAKIVSGIGTSTNPYVIRI